MSTKEEHVPPESLVYHSNLYTVVICIAHRITFFYLRTEIWDIELMIKKYFF